jgi:hypothetical protein
MLSPSQHEELDAALSKLFRLQNKLLDFETRTDFIDEIEKWRYPFQAIITAIQSLNDKDIRITLASIKQACEVRVENTYQQNHDYVSPEEIKYNGLYISKLRSIYGNEWFKHFNYPNYDTPMSVLDDLKRIAKERWCVGWEVGLKEAKNPLGDLINRTDPVVGEFDAIEPYEDLGYRK